MHDGELLRLVQETNLCPPTRSIGRRDRQSHTNRWRTCIYRTVPVFNLVPAQGEPARFGFEVIGKVPIVHRHLCASRATTTAWTCSVKTPPQTAGLLCSQVTLWGVPGDPAPQQRARLGMRGGRPLREAGRKAVPATSAEQEAALPDDADLLRSNPATEPLSISMDSRLLGRTRARYRAPNTPG